MAETTTRAADVRRRYDRIARFYDAFETPMDLLGGRRRRVRTVGSASGRTLEVGIGTGRNIEFYPPEVQLSGIDISTQMLTRAQRRADQLERPTHLEVADVEDLPFPDAHFDTVTATCVFCSVPDPITGLREVARVTRPGGQVLLLEHVRPRNRLLGWIFDRLTPLTQRLFGPAINRRTEANVGAAGLDITDVDRHGIWRLIQARPADVDTASEGPGSDDPTAA